MFFAAALFLAVGIASAQTPTLTHSYSFDGNYNDAVGSVNANPLWTYVDVSQSGISGNAAYFDGSSSLLLLSGTGVLPSSGAWTITYWEYADTADAEPDGYFFSDAGTNPLQNLYVRRYMEADPADPENSEISTPNGSIASNYFGKYHPSSLASGAWINHTITLTDEGDCYWYIDGQLDTFFLQNNPWAGLSTQDPEDPSGYEGLVIGNRIDGNRTYYGYLDEFQIYSGAVDGGMVNYLYANPGATLDTYDSVTYPDPGLPDVTPGPTSVLHWTFDANLTEASGNTDALGTAIGDVAVQAGTGIDGGAIYLDGDDDAVSVLGAIVPTGSVSFSFWAKTDGTTNGYMLGDSENYSNFFIRRDTNDTTMITGGIGTEANIENIGPNPEDTWQHVVVVSSQETGQVYCYVDGVLAEVSDYARTAEDEKGVLVGLLSDLYIGNRYDLNRDFKGWIDDLQIYDATLTLDEVAFLYANPGETLLEEDLPGDANHDDQVDASDATILAGNWQAGPGATWEMGDFNGDGHVDASDATILAGNWQAGTGAAAVPEPSTILLLISALVGWFIIRRR
jgi:hypothetical protein